MRRYLLSLVLIISLVYIGGVTATEAAEGLEAPMLAKMVAAGELPPLEERLPDEPVVVGPGTLIGEKWIDWKPGKYSDGRIIKTVDPYLRSIVSDLNSINFLYAPDQSSKDPIPVLAESVTHNDKYTEFTITIRKGLKWSDGVEVTTEDVRFVFEDVYQYDNGIAYDVDVHTQGDFSKPPAELNIIDKYSFSLTFAEPYGYFMAHLRSWIRDYTMLMQPSHVLKQYHPKYTDEAKLAKMAEEAGVAGWQQLFDMYEHSHWDLSRNRWLVGMPSLNTWIPTEFTDAYVVMMRNPYYCMVDTEGKQLPYIDGLYSEAVPNKEARTLKVISGELDYAVADFMKLQDMPTYLENAEKSGYRVLMTGSINGPVTLYINQDFDYENPDSQWQVVISDPEKRFARALALAIDSQDINDSMYFSLYQMPEITPAEYDPEKANQLLDEAGLTGRDADGWRTYPDGSDLKLTIEAPDGSPDLMEVAFMSSQFFQAVGLNVNSKQITEQLFNQRGEANQQQMRVHWHDEPIWFSGISEDYKPTFKGDWAVQTNLYYSSFGAEGRKPPAYLKEFFDIDAERRSVPPESPEGEELYAKLMQWFSDNLVAIWTTGPIQVPNMVSNEMRNIPNEGYPFNLGIIETAQQWYLEE